MGVKRCPKCGGSWSSSLTMCAFCGVPGVEEEAPSPVVLPGQRNPEQSPGAEEASVAVEAPPQESPTPPPPEDPAPVAREEKPEPPPPPPSPAKEASAPPSARLTPMPGRTEGAPVTKVPAGLGFLGLAACLLLPLAVLNGDRKWVAVVGFLLAGVFALCAPVAWYRAARYEERCRVAEVRPHFVGYLGRVLGVGATVILVIELALLCLAASALLLSGSMPPWLGGSR